MGDVTTLRPPAPWYAGRPNPGCLLVGCDRGHRLDEFADTAGLGCRILVADTEWYTVSVDGFQHTCWSTPERIERVVEVKVQADTVPAERVPGFLQAVLKAAAIADREQKRLDR